MKKEEEHLALSSSSSPVKNEREAHLVPSLSSPVKKRGTLVVAENVVDQCRHRCCRSCKTHEENTSPDWNLRSVTSVRSRQPHHSVGHPCSKQ